MQRPAGSTPGTPKKRRMKDFRRSQSIKTSGIHGPQHQLSRLSRALRGSQRQKKKSRSFYGPELGPLCIFLVAKLGVPVGCLTVIVGVSDSFACSWYLFPHIGLPHPALRGGFVPFVIVSWCAGFSWYHRKACSFLKGNGGGVDLVDRRGISWETGKSGGRETMVMT